jgi:low affinity Fe/Cu permease
MGRVRRCGSSAHRRNAIIQRMTNRTRPTSLAETFENFSSLITRFTGTTTAFGLALAVVIVWALLGPLFRFSDTWQLVINTSTTIVTFLMVFLIQRTQNKDSLAIHLKLNELVSAMEGASNRLIDVEALSEKELATLHRYYAELAKLARNASDVTESHSVEEARQRHSAKSGRKRSMKGS